MDEPSAKVHTYRVHLEWEGSTARGYDGYDRTHRLWALTPHGAVPPAAGPATDGGSAPGLAMSSDPAFLGDPGLLNPEQLLVAAAASCHLLSFLAVAARRRVDVVSYTDEAEGRMDETDRPVRVGTVTLRPHVVVSSPDGEAPDDDEVALIHEKAHHACFIANSVTTDIRVEGTIERRR